MLTGSQTKKKMARVCAGFPLMANQPESQSCFFSEVLRLLKGLHARANSRSVMLRDVLGCTRTTMDVRTSL